MLKMIAAMSENNVIGKEGKIPRKMPGDLKRFRELIQDQIVAMGKGTFDSLQQYFPNSNGHPSAKENIILSTTLEKKDGLTIHRDIQKIIDADKDEDIRIIWWQQIYEAFLKHADELYLTLIEGNYEGDAFFPEEYKDFFDEQSNEAGRDEWSRYIHYKKK